MLHPDMMKPERVDWLEWAGNFTLGFVLGASIGAMLWMTYDRLNWDMSPPAAVEVR